MDDLEIAVNLTHAVRDRVEELTQQQFKYRDDQIAQLTQVIEDALEQIDGGNIDTAYKLLNRKATFAQYLKAMIR